MTQLLTKISANFTKQLAQAVSIGGTTATLSSATDGDAINLPNGRYGFTIDEGTSSEEHITADVVLTALTNVKTVARTLGTETAAFAKAHRQGAEIKMTDFPALKKMLNLLDGSSDFDSATPLKYDGTASITTANQFATKAYVDGVAIAGAPDASTIAKGVVEEATEAEIEAGTGAGATSARLFVNPSTLKTSDYGTKVYERYGDYAADVGGTDAYAITLSPAPTAYTTGMFIQFKANTINTGACTINVNSLGAKAIKSAGADPVNGVIAAGKVYSLVYDGTNFEIVNAQSSPLPSPSGNTNRFLTTTDGSTLSFGQTFDVQTFTASGTWTKPSNLSGNESVLVELWGGGGAGGASTASNISGGGGGGGAFESHVFRASELGATETVTIGAGGVGGASHGAAGSTTTFGSVSSAFGGGGGATSGGNANAGGGGGGGVLSVGQSVTGTSGGTGGQPGGSAQNLGNPGYGGAGGSENQTGGSGAFGGAGGGGVSNGVTGGVGGAAIRGGAGGGGGGSSPGAGGVSRHGGAGGAGGNNAVGSNGVVPAGGGGGGGVSSSGTKNGGSGAAGKVRVTTFF